MENKSCMMCHKDSCNCKSNMTWMVIAALLIIGALGYYVYGMSNIQNTVPKKNVVTTGSDSMMKKDAMMKDAMTKSHGYMNYTSELATSAMKSGQTVVLFFAASWCPSCKALNKTIQDNLGSIPADTLVLRVDYDNSAELKKQYGVVTQHTTVVLNTDGTLKSKKIGAQTVSEVLGN